MSFSKKTKDSDGSEQSQGQAVIIKKKNHKWKAQKVKTNEGDLPNWGIPLTVIPKKETVQAKKNRDNKIRKKEVLQILDKQKWLPIQNILSISEPSLVYQSKDSTKV